MQFISGAVVTMAEVLDSGLKCCIQHGLRVVWVEDVRKDIGISNGWFYVACPQKSGPL